MRKFSFQTDGYYHLYNRGVDKRDIFIDEKDYVRFIRSPWEFNNESTDAQRDYEKKQAEAKGMKLSFQLETKFHGANKLFDWVGLPIK